MNLYLNARPDEVFYLQDGEPQPHWWGVRWLVRRVWWTNIFDASNDHATWVSWTFLWFFHFYHGTAKCDGTRTAMYWSGQLGEPRNDSKYVMTATPKEMLAVRFRRNGMDAVPVWNNMGGC